jgi:photosystem II stability/assembly factor-like uncharacterized protein
MLSIRSLPVIAVAAALVVACHDVQFQPRSGSGEIDIYDHLFSVSVPSEKRVVAAGDWGAVYLSEDGGDTWRKAKTDTKMLLYGVSMANEEKGWAVGQLGLVLRTDDGGKTWTHQPTVKEEQGVHLFAVQALDENRAWAVGEWGTRIYTDDGGRTWQDHSFTVDETHPQFVWLSVAEQEQVRNGEKVFEDVGLNDIFCLPANTQHCWIIGEFGYLFRTEDGGNRWERGEIISGIVLDPIELRYNSIEIGEEDKEKIRDFARQIADQQHLNVAIEPRVSAQEIREFGSEDDPTPLFDIIEARTQEVVSAVESVGILSDRIRRRGAPPWDYEDFLEDDPDFLRRYLDSRRADRPQMEVTLAQNPYLFTVAFSDENNGLISGLGGMVLKTTDGGRTWNYHDVGRKAALFAVQPFPRRAIAVGEKGLMRVSSDGGVSWEPPGESFPTLFTFMRDIGFSADEQIGFIVGQRGMVLRSEDGGGTWAQVLPPKTGAPGEGLGAF